MFSSFRRLVAAVWAVAIIGIGSMGVRLEATTAGSIVPDAVEIKLIKELDMDANPLSKLPAGQFQVSATSTDFGGKQKGEAPNLAQQNQFGRGAREKVYSFKRLVAAVWAVAIIGIGSMGVRLGDHVLLLLIGRGQYEW